MVPERRDRGDCGQLIKRENRTGGIEEDGRVVRGREEGTVCTFYGVNKCQINTTLMWVGGVALVTKIG